LLEQLGFDVNSDVGGHETGMRFPPDAKWNVFMFSFSSLLWEARCYYRQYITIYTNRHFLNCFSSFPLVLCTVLF
jgi:hypothetical protein